MLTNTCKGLTLLVFSFLKSLFSNNLWLMSINNEVSSDFSTLQTDNLLIFNLNNGLSVLEILASDIVDTKFKKKCLLPNAQN